MVYLYKLLWAEDFPDWEQTPSTLWKWPDPRISSPEVTICSGEKGKPLLFSASALRNGRRISVKFLTPSLENRYLALNSLSGRLHRSILSLLLTILGLYNKHEYHEYHEYPWSHWHHCPSFCNNKKPYIKSIILLI